MSRLLFVDIETSPCVGYFWRPGYNLTISHDNIVEESKIICISYKWQGEEEVSTLTWDKAQNDRAMLVKFGKVLKKADRAIAHNGDRFDLPWIRTRCLFHRIPFQADVMTLDTLKKARGGFKFNSNRLDYLGKFMGVGRKEETGGFGLWKDVMNGDKEALAKMVHYCEQDVQLLERVYDVMIEYLKPVTHTAVNLGGYRHECPYCSSEDTKRNKRIPATAAGTPKVELKCNTCRRYWTMSEATYWASLERKRKDRSAS